MSFVTLPHMLSILAFTTTLHCRVQANKPYRFYPKIFTHFLTKFVLQFKIRMIVCLVAYPKPLVIFGDIF